MKTPTKIISPLMLGLLMFGPNSAHASLGRKVNPKTLPEGLCRLEFIHNETGDTFHCTGSVIGKRNIKTAAHCFHRSTLNKVRCLGENKESDVAASQIYPEFDHEFIKRDKHNRWQDQAMITLKENLKVTPFKAVIDQSEYLKLLSTGAKCLIAGFGLQEQAILGTGFLSGSLYEGNLIDHQEKVLLARGRHLFELLPGDSGGPLLCYQDGLWYDLGSASAHDWDHSSVYAPNFEVRKWLSQFPIAIEAKHFAPLPQSKEKKITIEVGKTYYLKRYSQISELETNDSFFNGDNRYTTIEVDKVDGETVYGKVSSFGSSQFYLCEENFLCYGQSLLAKISINDISGQKISALDRLYDPFE